MVIYIISLYLLALLHFKPIFTRLVTQNFMHIVLSLLVPVHISLKCFLLKRRPKALPGKQSSHTSSMVALKDLPLRSWLIMLTQQSKKISTFLYISFVLIQYACKTHLLYYPVQAVCRTETSKSSLLGCFPFENGACGPRMCSSSHGKFACRYVH